MGRGGDGERSEEKGDREREGNEEGEWDGAWECGGRIGREVEREEGDMKAEKESNGKVKRRGGGDGAFNTFL